MSPVTCQACRLAVMSWPVTKVYAHIRMYVHTILRTLKFSSSLHLSDLSRVQDSISFASTDPDQFIANHNIDVRSSRGFPPVCLWRSNRYF